MEPPLESPLDLPLQPTFARPQRLDGRKRNQFRDLQICYGLDYGSCIVSLGRCKILAGVSAEIVEPPASRPFEGSIRIQLDLSPMASPRFEATKMLDENIEIQRLLEKTIKDSRCVDLESLCLISGEQVWEVQVCLTVLNADGNLAECGSIALMAALMHFRRPEVIVDDQRLRVCTFEEKHPLPLTILHYPFCTTFCFYEE